MYHIVSGKHIKEGMTRIKTMNYKLSNKKNTMTAGLE